MTRMIKRKMRIRSLALILQIVLCGIAGNLLWINNSTANDKRTCDVGELKNYQLRLSAAMQSTLVAPILGSAITVGTADGGQFDAKAGWRDISEKTSIDHTGLFQIGSQTKMFTSAAVQFLAVQGKLDLNDKLSKYIDISKIPADEVITIAQLLNHTSGMGDGISLFDPPAAIPTEAYSYDDMLMFARIKGKEFEAGAEWNYNNTAYHVLGKIIEKVSGQKLKNYLRENIFNPLVMGDTYLGAQEDWPFGKLNHGYAFNPGSKTVMDVTHPPSLNWAGPAGDMISSLKDLQTWMRALSTENANFPLKIADFKRHQVKPGFDLAPPIYGLGMSELNVGGRKMWGHGGYIHGYVSLSLYDLETGAVVTTFSTMTGSENEDFRLVKEVMLMAVGSAIHGLPNCSAK